ncbi:MAG TPA: 2-C-methyl-D-erythritol 4-phosphate cytidylyltransferase [Pyrinomonadaceae bacterium]|jgi:2-C-methyl-D-erythritol 4-phosphate cytidylyltransferase|nr:2-C-methyl-D-erythritol 4-phosphate cytidylyltransferase [Pyrinomonadaceae bacterium]
MNVAIVVAAGSGSRAGAGRAKQFREIKGIPIIIRTLSRFEACDAVGHVVAVVPAGEEAETLALARAHGLSKLSGVVAGGATRTESVRFGLDAAPRGAEVVAVHDGVRPFVTPEEIGRVVGEAGRTGAAILAVRAVDTIKEAGDDSRVARTLDRTRLWRALTPQCFRAELLRRALDSAAREGLDATDCSSLVERLGAPVRIVEGSPDNIKITTPHDFALAEILLSNQ